MTTPPPARDPRLLATYRVRADAASIEGRARAIAVEQSVEMPVEAITDPAILDGILGQVAAIEDRGDGSFDVRIALAESTTGREAGQLFNMLFGNTSIHDDVVLLDVELPAKFAHAFGGPRHGLQGLRARLAAGRRALTCSALKPQGSSAEQLAALAGRLALGGVDVIKDDHGLADQRYSPFAARVAAVSRVVAAAARATGKPTRYAPSLAGTLDDMRRQVAVARDCGIDTLLIAPMIAGVATFHALARDNPDIAFLTHPALAGACRIAPALHFGKLFRMLGGDGLVYPNHGGRFGYSAATCRDIAATALRPWAGMAPAVPIPAGGMTLGRVPDLLEFYGPDVMLLIGGALLSAGDHLVTETAAFVRAVENFRHPA
jgi:ribulose-bisphosphate carboxylase large chain